MGNKVQFVIDEASSLGHMEAIGDALDKYRGYGVRLVLLYQSLGQLKKCWPEGQDVTLLSNVSQVFFGVNDYQTAQYVSNRLGEETIAVDEGSRGDSGSRSSGEQPNASYSESWSTNESWKQAGRRLLKPEEVLALPERVAITFAPSTPPIATLLLRYFEESWRPPSGWSRWWSGLKTVTGAVTAFFVAGLLALLVTAGVHNHLSR